MTNKTNTLTIRLNTDDRERLAKYITRKSLESILRQIDMGEIEITENGVSIGVNTTSESVNTTIEPILENEVLGSVENSGVNTCEGCPYIEIADKYPIKEFEDACDFRSANPQQTFKKMIQMVWRS